MNWLFVFILFHISGNGPLHPWEVQGSLKVSSNGHFLQNQNGTPFLWIVDTGWGKFSQLIKEEVKVYLENLKNSGFKMIQSVDYWFSP